MKELQIASYEIVKLAVQKGFNWIESDDKFYDINSQKLDYTSQGYQESVTQYSRYPAPSLSLLQKWLMEEYEIYVQPMYNKDGKFNCMIVDSSDNSIGYETFNSFYTSYEGCLEEGIKEALTQIKNIK